MELDAELAAALQSIGARRALRTLDSAEDIAIKRAQSDELARALVESLDRSGVLTEERSFAGPGGNLRMRLHRPAGSAGKLPCLYSIHSGGMVSGSPLMDDRFLVPLVREVGCVGASVAYRLAPEHRAPAATEDAYAGLQWLFEQSAALDIDPQRVAIVGISGGGGIAAGTVLLARDRSGQRPCFQQLVYPQLDDRNVTASSHGDWLGWTRSMNVGAWRAVLGERYGGADVSPYVAPARATDLSGLPPAYVEVGTMEIFRDEAIEYATRLLAAGVQTELHVHPGCFHGFDIYVPQARVSRLAVAARRAALERAWGMPDR